MTGPPVTGVPVTWDWHYKNTTKTEVDLWLAIPPNLPSQPETSVVDSFPRGFGREDVRQTGANRLAFVSLPPGGHARLRLRAILAASHAPSLAGHESVSNTEPDALTHLEPGPLITLSDEVRAEAREAAGETGSLTDVARRLYIHLLRTCRYVWPSPKRGSESMRLARRGDCGEYSFLYAALCRSMGLPCRVLVGTLLGRRMLPHAWNEVYLTGSSWVRVDVRIPEIILGRLAARKTGWAAARAVRHIERRFGLFRPDRLAFSVDPGVALDPPFQERAVPEEARDMVIDGRPFAWGFEALEGGVAPYLQPCYVRFRGDKVPDRISTVFGSWRLARR